MKTKDLYPIVSSLYDALADLRKLRALIEDLEAERMDAQDFTWEVKRVLDRIEDNVRYAYDEARE
jgi:hypothetical protein